MAAGAHPDDIELMMAGTLILLGDAGYELHYMNIANGSCGSATMTQEQTITVRTQESINADGQINAIYHPPLVNDIEILYEQPLIRKLCATVREVKPQILLLPSPQDYMEDHMNASRLMVTAAFCRNMRNYECDPHTPPADLDMRLYHTLPWGLMDQLCQPIRPDFLVDIASVMPRKRNMLACHKSQKEWLDNSQGFDNYLTTMEEMSARIGQLSNKFTYAEGWRKHSHLGFCSEDFDPLNEVLSKLIACP